MPLSFFTIPISEGAAVQDELNGFLAAHRIARKPS